jgi:hypothetical protein
MKFKQYAEQADQHLAKIKTSLVQIDAFDSKKISTYEMHIEAEKIIGLCQEVEKILLAATTEEDVSIEEFAMSMLTIAAVVELRITLESNIKELNVKFH